MAEDRLRRTEQHGLLLPMYGSKSFMYLRFKNKTLDLSRAQIMGILNVTPDSFSDGGSYSRLDQALFHTEQMIKDGAAIVDIGGESTRPDAETVSAEEELNRVIPVVEAVAARFDTIISLDTSSPEVMAAGIAAGAHMINDVRSLTRPGALTLAAYLDVPVCLMHMQGTPQTMQQHPHYQDCAAEVKDYLLTRAEECTAAGIRAEHIVLDPGFGFGKSVQDNFALLKKLPELCSGPYPVLTGLSRKSMLGAVCGLPNPRARVTASAVGAVLCAQGGARILRVHDVQETAQALAVYYAVQEA